MEQGPFMLRAPNAISNPRPKGEITISRLTTTEQRALIRATMKLAHIGADMLNSRGLTEDEATVAARAGLIDVDQRWWWLESWQEGEREAERDMQAGKTETFETPEEFRNALQAL